MMSFPRFIPVLLLHDGDLVKTEQFKDPKYVGDPMNAVKIFNEKQVDELVFLDIDASKKQADPDYDYIADIAKECFMPFAYGGGVRTLDHVQRIIRLGAEKVILNTILFDDPDIVKQACAQFGQQSIVAAVDVRKNMWGKYHVYHHISGKTLKTDAIEWLRTVESYGVGEIMVTCVDREGTAKGFDTDFYSQIGDAVSVPVIANGGAGNMDDCRVVLSIPSVNAVAAGRMFVFHGKYRAVLITYPKYAEIKTIFGQEKPE